MTVESIMTKEVVTVGMDTTLGEIKNVFDNVEFHHLLVLDSDALIGVISDRDLFKALSPNIFQGTATLREAAALNKKAHQIMSRKPVTLSAGSSIKAAVGRFLEHDVSCLPIVDDEGRVQGIVSWKDVFKYLLSLNAKT